ncbi:MAG TPA: hypothetical protein PKI14_03255 [Fervidobacterium sp.]|nr:hypothetical protein [Fervidobacterium sp.]
MALPNSMKLHTVVIKRRNGTEDSYKCLMTPYMRSPFRPTVVGASADTVYRLFLDPDVEITVRDLIIWEGQSFVVEGNPLKVPNPMGGMSHIEVLLKEYEL